MNKEAVDVGLCVVIVIVAGLLAWREYKSWKG
jgi:hypothetical protein